MGVKVDSLILQLSAPADRTEKEQELADAGLVPFLLFANSPQNIYLLGARPVDLEAAFAAAHDRAEGLGAERLAIRMRLFDEIAHAIETDMKFLVDEMQFPNSALTLLIDGLYQYGIESPEAVLPCAMRFSHALMQEPDFELAGDPPDDEAEPAAPDGPGTP